MSRVRADRALVLAGLVLLLALPACGKKAPLRLPDSRAAAAAPLPRARVREGLVTLDFQVPRQRIFPEREEPWVLARILRQATGATAEAVEAGSLLETGGFAFGAPLSWTDREQQPGSSVYRVEFRDAARRRALSAPLTVAWDRVPAAPVGFSAGGVAGAIALAWEASAGGGEGLRYRIYRRESAQPAAAPLSPEPLAQNRYVDSRVETGREYCYTVRAVLVTAQSLEVEGAAGAEACARAVAAEPAPQRPADAGP
jgi:predicted small lipoprotein YifL